MIKGYSQSLAHLKTEIAVEEAIRWTYKKTKNTRQVEENFLIEENFKKGWHFVIIPNHDTTSDNFKLVVFKDGTRTESTAADFKTILKMGRIEIGLSRK